MPEHATLVSTTDPWSQGIVALVLAAFFFLIAKETAHRVVVAMTCVSFVWIVSYLTPFHLIGFDDAAAAVNLNVLMLLAGMMALVGVVKTTGGFVWATSRLAKRTRGRPRAAVGLMMWVTGLTSAFLDNVSTMLWVTPTAMRVSKRTRLPPAVLLLPMLAAANIGGAALLISDPPNMIIGSETSLTFIAFLMNLAAPILVMLVLLQWYTSWYHREAFAGAREAPEDEVSEDEPRLGDPVLFRWTVVIWAAVLIGFFTQSLNGTPVAVPAVIGAAVALVVQDFRYVRAFAPTPSERAHGILRVLERDIEWPALAFYMFLFILVGAAEQTGLTASAASAMEWILAHASMALSMGDRGVLLFAALATCWVSAVLSAFIDPIPYVALSIPILARVIDSLPGETQVLWWALTLGACLGGNATVVGSSANVTTLGLIRKEGQRIRFGEYSRFAVPMTILTLAVSSLFLIDFVYAGGSQARLTAWIVAGVLIAVEAVMARRRSPPPFPATAPPPTPPPAPPRHSRRVR